jgi:hypothetical protein
MNSRDLKAPSMRNLSEAELSRVTGGSADMIPLRDSRLLDDERGDIIPLRGSLALAE